MAESLIPVNTEVDICHVRRNVQQIAAAAGFPGHVVAEIAIVATELATNLVRHKTIDGEIFVAGIAGTKGTGLEIVSRDRGPGISDLHLAVRDNWSSNGTLGCGLGAVQRLMDEFDIRRHPAQAGADGTTDDDSANGTLITTRKWLRNTPVKKYFDCSVNSRPHPGETANGDSFFVHEDQGTLLVAIADGLGHGPKAAQAGKAATDYLENNRHKEFEDLFHGLQGVLHATRGAAVTIVRVSYAERSLFHAGIGNVETRLYPVGASQLVTTPGILGTGTSPRPRINRIDWPADGTLVLYSDGISNKWDFNEIPADQSQNAVAVCHYLMRNFSRHNDDATIAIVREASNAS